MRIIASLLCVFICHIAMAQTPAMLPVDSIPVVGHEKPGFFTLIEKMPVYPGGEDALLAYISSQMRYPQQARKRKIEGVVYISYVVEVDGSVGDVKVVKGVHELLDAEGVRVISTLSGYEPGFQKGKPVRVQFTIPLRFKL